MTNIKILIAIIVTCVSFMIATQWFAYHSHYAAWLGSSVLTVLGHNIYAPWKIIIWAYQLNFKSALLRQSIMIITAGSVVLMFIGLVLNKWGNKKNSITYGSSRFATLEDIKKANLLEDKGVFLAQLPNGKYLRHDGFENVAVVAPPRKKKGVSILIPTLLSWTESVVAYDVRSEAWIQTSGYRSKFSHAIYWNPTDPASACNNPLLEVRMGEYEIRDIQTIVDVILDPTGKEATRSHWKLTAFTLLVTVILHCLYAEKDKTLSGVQNYLNEPGIKIRDKLMIIQNTLHLGDKPHPAIPSMVQEMLNKPDEELGSVVSTANSHLNIFRDPIVQRITSRCDFNIKDLMHSDHPISLYISVPPSDRARTLPVIRMLLNQIFGALTQDKVSPGKPHYKHRLLMALDEMPTLGRLEALQSSLAYFGGYGIKTLLIMQGLDQLASVYGNEHSIWSSVDVKVVYAANDNKTANYFSVMSGPKTETRAQTNLSGSRLSLWLGQKSVSSQETARPLLTHGEILQLPKDDALIFVSSTPPIMAKKFSYLNNKLFSDRVLPEIILKPYADLYEDVPIRTLSPWASLPEIPKPVIKKERKRRQKNKSEDIFQEDEVPMLDVIEEEYMENFGEELSDSLPQEDMVSTVNDGHDKSWLV